MTLSIYLYNTRSPIVALALIFSTLVFTHSSHSLMVKNGKAVLEKLTDYELCHSRNQATYCHEALSDWVEKNPSQAFEAGKLTKKHMSPWTAMGFFDKAWSIKPEDCSDADVKQAVLSALKLSPENNQATVDQALKMAFTHCEKQISSSVAEQAKVSEFILKNSCKPLMAKKMLTGVAAKKCSKN